MSKHPTDDIPMPPTIEMLSDLQSGTMKVVRLDWLREQRIKAYDMALEDAAYKADQMFRRAADGDEIADAIRSMKHDQ